MVADIILELFAFVADELTKPSPAPNVIPGLFVEADDLFVDFWLADEYVSSFWALSLGVITFVLANRGVALAVKD